MFITSGFRKTILTALMTASGAMSVHAQQTIITGTVKDASSAAIAGATVTLLSDLTVTGTTDATGAFTLTFGTADGIAQQGKGADAIAFNGTEVAFTIGKGGAEASVSLYDVHGNSLKTIFASRLPSGKYSVSAAPAGLNAGVYIVRAQAGNLARTYKMSTISKAPFAANGNFHAFGNQPALAKTSAGGVDWLIVTKTGYLKTDHEIMAYTDAQTIVMSASAAATGNLKLFSDSSMSEIDWPNAAIYSWDQTATLLVDSTHAGYNGSVAVMNVSTAPGMTWNGWAFHVAKTPNGLQPTVDLSPYANGSLHFAIKGNAPSIGVMMSSLMQPSGSAPLVDLSTKGYAPDSAWHQINIPLTDFNPDNTLVLSDIFVYAGFVMPVVQGGAFDAAATYQIDDVYFTPSK